MAKKTARAAKPSQQRSKEEQWRRRMSAQGRTGAGSAVVEAVETVEAVDAAAEDGDLSSEEIVPQARTRSTTAPRGAATTKSAARTETRAQSSTVAQRRAAGATSSYAQRSARARLAATSMSIEDEMHYIKADIRKLVVLTGLCVLVIIALAFVLPMIMV